MNKINYFYGNMFFLNFDSLIYFTKQNGQSDEQVNKLATTVLPDLAFVNLKNSQ